MSNQRKAILLILFLTIAVVATGAFIALCNTPAPIPTALPSPNGYSAFLQAGSLVQKGSSDYATMSLEQLRITVAGNSNALQIARSGLAEKSQVPERYSPVYAENHLRELADIRLLAQAFLAEGKLAEMEQLTNGAEDSYLDAIRLGIECPRGGTLIDALVGNAIEAMGTWQLKKVIPNLDAKTSGEMAHQLEALDATKETWGQVLQEEKYWSRRTFPGLEHRVGELVGWYSLRASKAKAKQRLITQQTKTRKLIIDLAARAYELDKGHRPAAAADLVPKYLNAIPQDPVTGKNQTLTP